ncbi:TSUP family transporter [Nocardioides sp.]|uniref:TSUP family transporter n=1 Tax=Nocardioides sp. TaxID=35761 RepID=UPI002733EED7|nr:TSUP family transporter [Nocardioides sp.]MDP3892592.1 TSUP family transporter [Nocardioides sp.]
MAAVELATGAWLLLALAAFLVGFAKTAIGGIAALAVVIFAAVLPARESTGVLLPLLLCGDLVAVSYYRRHADWATLLCLLPGVLPGLVLGAAFIAVVDNRVMVRSIGLACWSSPACTCGSDAPVVPAPCRSPPATRASWSRSWSAWPAGSPR